MNEPGQYNDDIYFVDPNLIKDIKITVVKDNDKARTRRITLILSIFAIAMSLLMAFIITKSPVLEIAMGISYAAFIAAVIVQIVSNANAKK